MKMWPEEIPCDCPMCQPREVREKMEPLPERERGPSTKFRDTVHGVGCFMLFCLLYIVLGTTVFKYFFE